MKNVSSRQTVVPLVEERLAVGKNRVESGRVRIRTVLDERSELVRDRLESEDVAIERVPVGREVSRMPEWRREGDILVIPLVEEVLIVEKKLVLKEELRVRVRKSSRPFAARVNLRSTRAEVERRNTNGQAKRGRTSN